MVLVLPAVPLFPVPQEVVLLPLLPVDPGLPVSLLVPPPPPQSGQ